MSGEKVGEGAGLPRQVSPGASVPEKPETPEAFSGDSGAQQGGVSSEGDASETGVDTEKHEE